MNSIGGMWFKCIRGWWRDAELRPAVGVNQPLCVPCSPSGGGGGDQEGDRSGEARGKLGAIVGICHHCEILRHIDAANEDRLDIVAVSPTSECHPRIIMAFRVFFEGGFGFDILPVSMVIGDKGRPSFLSEFKREAGARFQESKVTVRNAAEMKFDVPYGAAETEALRSVPVPLRVPVQR